MSGTALVTYYPMTPTNGGGAQLHAMVDAGFGAYHHFWYGTPESVGVSTCRHSSGAGRLERLIERWPWSLGKGWLRRTARATGWFPGQAIDAPRFRRLLQRLDMTFSVAYLSPNDESDCQRMASLVEVLGCPYVVHLWDLNHPGVIPLPANVPALTRLMGRAKAVLCISQHLASALAPLTSVPLEVVAFGRAEPAMPARPPAHGHPLRIALMGVLTWYPDGLTLLAKAWTALSAAGLSCQLVFIGRPDQRRLLPDAVLGNVEYHGFLSNQARDQLLSTCHLAYLPGPNRHPDVDATARYSVPSRSADYLLHGLPILGHLHPQSAAWTTFEPALGQSIFPLADAAAMVPLVRSLSDPVAWQAASEHARTFARARFTSRHLSERVCHHLDAARTTRSG